MKTPFQDLGEEDFEMENPEEIPELEDDEVVEMRHKNSFFASKGYLNAMAKTKYKHLWDEIKRDAGKSGSFPWKISMPGLFAMNMNNTFDHKGDPLKGLMFGR